MLFGTAAAAATACAGRGVIVGATGVQRLSVHDEANGLVVVLTTGVWSGDPPDLSEHWTVVHVLVGNRGNAPVLLAPGDFELRDRRGFAYPLIDPGAAFFPATAAKQAVGAYGRTLHRNYDPGGPMHFIPVDTAPEISALALPWGVLEPGTQMRGFLYFEDMAATSNGGALTWHAGSPDHEPWVDLRFDLAVARPTQRRG